MDLGGPYLSSENYDPPSPNMGLSGLEPPTSRLSGVRSNRLSYKPSVNSLLKYLGYFAIRLINASRLFRHVLRTSCPVALALMQVNLHRA